MKDLKSDGSYPIVPFQYYLLGLIPIPVFHGTLQVRPMMPIQVLKYTILVLQPAKVSPLRWRILYRCETSALLRWRGGCGCGDS